jgi:hypothetical protein
MTRNPRLLLALEIAITDVRQAKQAIGSFAENLGYGASHGSEAHERDPMRGGALECSGRRLDLF